MNKKKELDLPFIIIVACIICCMAILLSGSYATLLAQSNEIQIASSFNPVGSGARAIGMGGAFIGVANDATAASWNPGGLFQLELPEVSITGKVMDRREENRFEYNPEALPDQGVSENSINYLSIAYPFHLFRRNMVASINYQNLYDFNRRWHFPVVVDSQVHNIVYDQEGGLSALGIAYCIEVTERFSFGLTFNIWDDLLHRNRWEQNESQSGPLIDGNSVYIQESSSFDRYSFRGFNVNLGMQLQLFNDALSLGAVLKTPFEADIHHDSSYKGSIYDPNDPDPEPDTYYPLYTTDERLEMPLSFGIGLAYRVFHGFTLSLDVYRTEWGRCVLKDEQGNRTSLVTGRTPEESSIKATHQVRMGTEYFIIKGPYKIPLRAGIFYDPAPAPGNPDDFYGFSLGSGIKAGGLDFDLAYQYRWGREVNAHLLPDMKFSQDVREHSLYLSLIYHFGGRYFF